MESFGARGAFASLPEFLTMVKEIAMRNGVVIQVLDAELVYGRLHLVSAYRHAVRALKEGRNATESLGLETLLYASGESQIQKALAKMGVKPETTCIAVLIASQEDTQQDLNGVVSDFLRSTGFVRDDGLLEGDRETLRRFGISDREVATVTAERYGDLVLERVAMVDVFKR
jgi:KEOPS complex subunit Cgi121